MNKWKTVNQNCNIIPVLVVAFILLILVDDLKPVVVDIRLVYESDVDCRAIIFLQVLYVIFLDCTTLLDYSIIGICNNLFEEPIPLTVSESEVIQQTELCSLSILMNSASRAASL